MNLSVFRTATTNVFPAVNTHTGGQLLTEYNLRSRESVETPSNISYFVGHCFCHSRGDFKIGGATDGTGITTSHSQLQINKGRAVVNGHYVETLVPIVIDMVELNKQATNLKLPRLEGLLAVGIRAIYATDQTLAGSILTEHQSKTIGEDGTGDMFEGIQLVILPEKPKNAKDVDSDTEYMVTPIDSPDDPDAVNAHIKLGSFMYLNGGILEDTIDDNYPERCNMFSADRISNLGDSVGNIFVRKTGLNLKHLYTFSGKGTDPKEPDKDTWCISDDALMVWDANPEYTNRKPSSAVSNFFLDTDGRTKLQVVHKQIDKYMKDEAGGQQYFKSRNLALPLANFNTYAGGTVDAGFIKSITRITDRMRQYWTLPNGKQRGYVKELDTRVPETSDQHPEDSRALPKPLTDWNVGDYVVVGTDNTVASTDGGQSPSTIYVILPGPVISVTRTSPSDSSTAPSGTEIAIEEFQCDTYADYQALTAPQQDTACRWVLDHFNMNDATFVGSPGDYVTVTFKFDGQPEYDVEDDQHFVETYHFVVLQENIGGRKYCDPPLRLTGNIQLATEETIGGFYNVDITRRDEGLVYLDNEGHLRLMDYTLLRSGTLAYQLGDNLTISGGSISEVQEQLNDYVNERVAFPLQIHTENAVAEGEDTSEIRINLELSNFETDINNSSNNVINIHSIDSRFGTDVLIHMTGDTNSNTIVRISDCQKVRLSIESEDPPTIEIYRSCVYYDAEVFDQISKAQDLSIWYRKFESTDPDLMVNGMTVIDSSIDVMTEQVDYWTETVANDNHYSYALQSITLSPYGAIAGAGIYIKNDSTNNLMPGQFLIGSKFKIASGAGLKYPKTWMKNEIRIDGGFSGAFPNMSPPGYLMTQTRVQAVLKKYNKKESDDVLGSITFFSDTSVIGSSSIIGLDITNTSDSLEHNTFHVIQGWVTNWNQQ